MLLNTYRRPDVLTSLSQLTHLGVAMRQGAKDSLLGEAFRADLTKVVEKDTALLPTSKRGK